MKQGAIGLLLVLLGAWLVGCQAISEAVRGELQTMSQPSERAVEVETAAAEVAQPTPTTAPAMTPTPRGRVVAEPTPAPTATPRVAQLAEEPTPEPIEDLRQECALLWDLMLAGQGLVDEWHAWLAADPASPQAHLLRLEQMARRWEAHARRAAATAVIEGHEPIRSAYLEAVTTYWGSVLLARDTIQRSDQRTGPQAAELTESATALWYAAFDQIDALCRLAHAGEPPLPTVAAPRPILPTPTPQ